MKDYDSIRPEVKVEYKLWEKVVIAIGVLGILFSIVYLVITWGDLPKEIPVHFNGAGEVDNWGNKGTLMIFPILCTITYGLMMVFTLFPNGYNYTVKITRENAENQYRNARELINYMNTEMVLFFAFLEWSCIQVALGQAKGLAVWSAIVFVVVLFITLGYKIYKMYKLK